MHHCLVRRVRPVLEVAAPTVLAHQLSSPPQAPLAAATPGPYGRDALTLEVYGRNGQMCSRCADSIDVTRTDGDARLLYWCPGCQTRMDRRLLDDTPVTLDREPDPR